MSRTRLLAATAALLLSAVTRAEEPKPAAAPVDPKVEALVKQAVEKAKQELRDELRVEVQGAQSAAEFLGTAAEGPKLEFLELDGYLRLRGALANDFDLGRSVDTNGFPLYPQPLINPAKRGTLASSNLRLRLEPTFNVSEHVRVRSQVDVLDNYVLGGTVSFGNFVNTPGGLTSTGANGGDRPAVNVKRVWGEVETPVGLLSFGRMPATWGMGIRHPVQDGLDDDFGDTVDRLQFATLPLSTPLGAVSLVPFLDFRSEGALQTDPHFGAGAGQSIDLDSTDDARVFGLKVLHLDTEEEVRRKLERNESSLSYGLNYEYQTWNAISFPFTDTNGDASIQVVERREYEHALDLWFRYRTARFHLEGEFAGQVGQIGNPTTGVDPGDPNLLKPYAGPQVQVRLFGGALRASYQVVPNKFSMGAEFGIASGDKAPGFGNRPNVLAPPTVAGGSPTQPTYGALEGPQFGTYSFNGRTIIDSSIRNFRFNPGYRVDLILWREILGQVTDAMYLKPSIRWDIVSGLAFDASVIYSQAVYSQSTPSSSQTGNGQGPLGLELDTKLSYRGDEGFAAWFEYGVLQPLDGMGPGSLSRAHAFRAGLAIKF